MRQSVHLLYSSHQRYANLSQSVVYTFDDRSLRSSHLLQRRPGFKSWRMIISACYYLLLTACADCAICIDLLSDPKGAYKLKRINTCRTAWNYYLLCWLELPCSWRPPKVIRDHIITTCIDMRDNGAYSEEPPSCFVEGFAMSLWIL